jgi:hypothetical protein
VIHTARPLPILRTRHTKGSGGAIAEAWAVTIEVAKAAPATAEFDGEVVLVEVEFVGELDREDSNALPTVGGVRGPCPRRRRRPRLRAEAQGEGNPWSGRAVPEAEQPIGGELHSITAVYGRLEPLAGAVGAHAHLRGLGRSRSPSPEARPSICQVTILPRFALNGHSWPDMLQPP